jgi:hypothetical protein
MTLAKRLLMEGEAKGEAKRDTEITMKMLQNGLKPKEIAKYTGIELDFILDIQKKLKK